MGAPITCASCQRRVLVSKEANWTGTRADGSKFTICGRRECFADYGNVFRGDSTRGAGYVAGENP